jgi:hypothetical protein
MGRFKRSSITSRKRSHLFFSEDEQGVLWYKGRICVPNVKELKD